MLELARPSDWEAVKCLSVQVHDLHAGWRPDIYCSTEEPYPKDVFLSAIRDRIIYVAKLDNTVVGYVTLSVKERGGPGVIAKKVMHLESICVEESMRGHGIGKEMVRDVRALAKAFGCHELQLSVLPENDSAVAFYQKCGFRIRTIHMDATL